MHFSGKTPFPKDPFSPSSKTQTCPEPWVEHCPALLWEVFWETIPMKLGEENHKKVKGYQPHGMLLFFLHTVRLKKRSSTLDCCWAVLLHLQLDEVIALGNVYHWIWIMIQGFLDLPNLGKTQTGCVFFTYSWGLFAYGSSFLLTVGEP